MIVDYWDSTQLNLWWKRKLEGLGYKQLKQEHKEGVCAICNKTDVLFPLGGTVVLCERCFDNFHSAEKWKAYRFFDVWGVKCNVCDKTVFIAWKVLDARVCIKCLWKRLGKQKRVLKVEGERV